MEKLKAILLCLLAVLLSALCVGCGGRPKAPPDYRQVSFRAELLGTVEDVTVTADGLFTRSDVGWELTLRLTSPPALAGAVLCEMDGRRTLSFEGMDAEADALSGLYALLSLPVTEGAILPLSIDSTLGVPLVYAQIEGETPTELWLDPDSGAPRQIRQGALLLEIRGFESIASDT